jgi:hypothetical protein
MESECADARRASLSIGDYKHSLGVAVSEFMHKLSALQFEHLAYHKMLSHVNGHMKPRVVPMYRFTTSTDT